MALALVLCCEAEKDLLGVPVEERGKVCVDVKLELDKVLDVAVHVPLRLSLDAVGTVRGAPGQIGRRRGEDSGACEDVKSEQDELGCGLTLVKNAPRRGLMVCGLGS